MKLIECTTLYKKKKLVPIEKLSFRPSGYAIIENDGKILLNKMRTTQKYYLPGGGVDIGEKLEEALTREVMEETGIEIEIKELMGFKETFFYYDILDEAYHCFLFFYRCSPLNFDLATGDEIQDPEVEKPCWVEIPSLNADDFQGMGEYIMKIVEQKR
jgi:nucleoside triphosphatase